MRLRRIIELLERITINERKIMATQQELVATVNAANEKLVALQAKESAQTEQIKKIQTEIKALKDAVVGGNLDDITAAVAALSANVDTLAATSEAGHAATQAADDENPDAPAPTPTP